MMFKRVGYMTVGIIARVFFVFIALILSILYSCAVASIELFNTPSNVSKTVGALLENR